MAGASANVLKIHDDLRKAIRGLGRVRAGAVRTLVYFSDRAHFCSVHLRRGHVLLEFVSKRPIRHRRIERTIRLGPGRYVNIARLDGRSAIDRTLAGWLREAYELERA